MLSILSLCCPLPALWGAHLSRGPGHAGRGGPGSLLRSPATGTSPRRSWEPARSTGRHHGRAPAQPRRSEAGRGENKSGF